MSALKIIYKGKLHKEEIKIIRGEANILELLEGKKNIVQLKNFYETQHYILIEMEYLGGGQLKQLYEKRLEILKRTLPRKNKKPTSAIPGKMSKKKSKQNVKPTAGINMKDYTKKREKQVLSPLSNHTEQAG